MRPRYAGMRAHVKSESLPRCLRNMHTSSKEASRCRRFLGHDERKTIAMECRLRCAAFVLATAMAWAGTVRATDDSAKGAARELANAAKGDFDTGKFEEASSKFQRAYEIAKVPTLAVWAARAELLRPPMQ